MLKTASSVINALGALVYQGTWNASTNTPTLVSSVGTKGNYYVVSNAGTTTLDGISVWSVGDWAVFNGTVWQKVDGGTSESYVNITVTGTANIATGNIANLVSSNVQITGGNAILTTVNAVTSNVATSIVTGNQSISGNVTVTGNASISGTITGNVSVTGGNVSANLSGSTNVPVANAVGTLAVGHGGTGVTTSTGSGNVVLSTSPSLTTPVLGTPTSGNLSNCTNIPVANATGTLVVSNGGTGITSLTANYIPYGNGTSAFNSSSAFTYNGTTLSAGNFVPSSSSAPTNGLFLPTTNAIAWATNSTERMRIASSGGLSIGNMTDPGATNLSVTGTIKTASTLTSGDILYTANQREVNHSSSTGSAYLNEGINIARGIASGSTTTLATVNIPDNTTGGRIWFQMFASNNDANDGYAVVCSVREVLYSKYGGSVKILSTTEISNTSGSVNSGVIAVSLTTTATVSGNTILIKGTPTASGSVSSSSLEIQAWIQVFSGTQECTITLA